MKSALARWIILAVIPLSVAASPAPVRLVSTEREPYIGEQLPQQGYVHQVVREAFIRAGYPIEVSYYPQARARLLLKQGQVDGMVPVHDDADHSLLYSAPFPGYEMGLLLGPHSPPIKPSQDRQQLWPQLGSRRIGVLRGGYVLPELVQRKDLKIIPSNSELQNLDKLFFGRIDYLQIDKYTAADLMAQQRPHYIGQLHFLPLPMASLNFHLTLPRHGKRSQKLLDAFNRGLASMKSDGSLNRQLSDSGLSPRLDEPVGKTRLIIATVNNPEMKMMRVLSTQFTVANPDIQLEWREYGEKELRRRILGDLAIGNNRYDIVTLGNFETPLWAAQGWLSPLGSLAEKLSLEDFFPRVLTGLSDGKKVYALPFYSEGLVTYYRTDLLRQAGLVMPDKPSFGDIERLARRLHNPTQEIYGICLRGQPGWGVNMGLITSWVHAFGGSWFDSHWQPMLTSPPWQQALATYHELLSQYGPPEPQTLGYLENLALFAKGHCAIWIDATVAAGTLFNPEESQVHDNVGLVAPPHAIHPSRWLWSWALAIPSSSEHQSAARRFIDWATSATYLRLAAHQYGWLAVPPGSRRFVYAESDYLRQAPFAKQVREILEETSNHTPEPLPNSDVQFVGIPEYSSIGNRVGTIVALTLTGKLTPQQALSQAQNLVEKQAQQSGYIKQKATTALENSD